MSASEFERAPVAPEKLQPARHFAATYASEHVAGTEFVIGALFVAWRVSTTDILLGLLLGNLLAVLTWGLICAPIAVDTRLTLYAYLEKIAGRGTIKLYSVVNGILFCVLAGAMITVSASAVRILFDIPPQVNWYPTSIAFVLVALAVGAVMVGIAVRGFRGVAQFAEVCAPWMILMFFVGALALMPTLIDAAPGVQSLGSFDDFMQVADTLIWQGTGGELGFWHVAAFAWVANLAMHGGLSDMTILRFARKPSYGYFSALGMFIGHYGAWVCAGIMGAGAALLLGTGLRSLDPGGVAYQAMGFAGIIAVIIAGWTTSNPTIYRAGLAFQSLNPNWSRTKVTVIAGVATSIIACFPFVFTKLLGFVGLMGLLLAPVGAIVVAEHWLFPRIGLTRYWSGYSGQNTNRAAIIAWVGSLLAAFLMNQAGLHLFFLLVPTWVCATVIYVFLARQQGATVPHTEAAARDAEQSKRRLDDEESYLKRFGSLKTNAGAATASAQTTMMGILALASLGVCAVMAIATYTGQLSLNDFRALLIWPSLAYFVTATIWAIGREKADQRLEQRSHGDVHV